MRQDEITEVVERSAKLVAEHYVFPDVAERVAAHLGDRLRDGRYAGAGTRRRSPRWSPRTSSRSTAACTCDCGTTRRRWSSRTTTRSRRG